MSNRDGVAAAIEQLGPMDDDILSVLQTPDATWIVRFEDLDIEFAFDDDARRLSLAVAIGRVPAARASDVYGTLLKYNLIRGETGGIVMALDPEGTVVQTLDLDDDRITADLCLTVLRNFTAKARIWLGYIAAEQEASDDRPSLVGEDLSFSIRV